MDPDSVATGLTNRQVNELAKQHLIEELATRGVRAATGAGSSVGISSATGDPVQLSVRAKRGPLWQTSNTYSIQRTEPAQPDGRFWVLVDLRPDVPSFPGWLESNAAQQWRTRLQTPAFPT